ncbi:MAG: sensor histidine kinase [Rubrivivax sp.]
MVATPPRDRIPSIRSRLLRALTPWTLVWGALVGTAVWLAASHEVDELLDETLQASASLLSRVAPLLPEPRVTSPDGTDSRLAPTPSPAENHFAWQLVSADGEVLNRSRLAPVKAWHASAVTGFSEHSGWRVLGVVLDQPAGATLYVAQSLDERQEALTEVTVSALLSGLAVALLAHLWIRLRVERGLQPIQVLSQRIAALDWQHGAPPQSVGQADREELAPVVEAIDTLTSRLAARLSAEQAFVAHAAHALRTPLAGIDAQLAVLQREAIGPAAERLGRVRSGATHLQAVVAALIGLFREASSLQRQRIPLAAVLQRWTWPNLALQADESALLDADPDLLTAALLNLLDNCTRHGASQVTVDVLSPTQLRLTDNGPGVDDMRRQQLQASLDNPAEAPVTGLGLLLADRVARAHGGRARLLPCATGFSVLLALAPDVHGSDRPPPPPEGHPA